MTVTHVSEIPWTETDLPHIKLRRNPAGGYIVGRIGGLQQALQAAPEGWLAAIHAVPEDSWSASSKWDGARCFRHTRLESQRSRNYKHWLSEKLEEVRATAHSCNGLTSYEVAALLGRSVRTARRFLKRCHAQRGYYRPNCWTRKKTSRYVW